MYEAMKIGVTLSLKNEFSVGLARLISDVSQADKKISGLSSKLRGLGVNARVALGGMAAMGLGTAIAASLAPAITEARKMETAVAGLKVLGLSPEQTAEAVSFAKAMDIAGSSYVQNVKLMTEAQGIFRETGLDGAAALEGAKLAAPTLAKLQTIAKMSGHGLSEAQERNFLRAIEMSGGLRDASTFNQRADLLYRLVGSESGNVSYEDMRAFYARGGASAKSIDDVGLMKLAPVIGELKGTSTGTALMTAYNRLNGNVKLPNQIIHELVNAGVWNRHNITWNSLGGARNIRSQGLLKGADLLASDPVAWENQVLEPMYKKLGIVTQNQKNLENAKLFGRTGGNMFTLIQTAAQSIDRSPDAINKHEGIDQAYVEQKKTTNGQTVVAVQGWHDLLNNIGTVILPSVNAGLTSFSGFLGSIANWTRDNPGLTRAVAYLAAATSGVLILGGALAVFTAAMALVSWPITLTVAAITGLIALGQWLYGLNWAAIWDGIKNGVMSFINWIGDAWKHRPTWLGGDGEVNPAPQIGVNGATKADRDYYAALNPPANINTVLHQQTIVSRVPPIIPSTPATAAANPPTTVKGGAVRTAASRPVMQGNVYLDNKKVGVIVDKTLGSAVGSFAQSNTYDPTFGQASAGMTY
jgi:hypothetical protein